MDTQGACVCSLICLVGLTRADSSSSRPVRGSNRRLFRLSKGTTGLAEVEAIPTTGSLQNLRAKGYDSIFLGLRHRSQVLRSHDIVHTDQ